MPWLLGVADPRLWSLDGRSSGQPGAGCPPTRYDAAASGLFDRAGDRYALNPHLALQSPPERGAWLIMQPDTGRRCGRA